MRFYLLLRAKRLFSMAAPELLLVNAIMPSYPRKSYSAKRT
ncbi:hypothetical protein HMPREF0372_01249 [Flavonifractor plautii ATCC 29863]|uniref:Uncharacterized protein n=1 Tax=Flavonifractor plautii ATCC 29863 TaxID=411475 RepID=G9YP07_FLAPL|nr:hypothetical protein HMPREF0372_01249 [Flavonifractor plautii ATCC 29863]